MPSHTALQRIKKDLKQFYEDSKELNIQGGPIDEDMFSHQYTIIVPNDKENPYYGAHIKVQLQFTQDYPFKPPKVAMLTQLYHPNFQGQNICLDILKSTEWSPALTITKLLISIESLLTDPNPQSPLNPEAARLYIQNRNMYNQKVHEFVVKYASV